LHGHTDRRHRNKLANFELPASLQQTNTTGANVSAKNARANARKSNLVNH
jgi:hypothetical protein